MNLNSLLETWEFTAEDLKTKSLAEILAQQTPEIRNEFYDSLDSTSVRSLEYDWSFWGRPKQLIPNTSFVYILAPGRGFGKTRASSEWVRSLAENYPGIQIALVGRTYGDVSKTMILGQSGILSICPPDNTPEYKKQQGVLEWANGSRATIYTADKPSALRGPTVHAAAADELAAWNFVKDDAGTNAWDNLLLATREVYSKDGKEFNPQILVTTTPKPSKEFIEINERAEDPEEKNFTIIHGSSYENKANLGKKYFETLESNYKGTDLFDQEVNGMLLGGKEGALWTYDLIEECRKAPDGSGINAFIISIDPSVSENPNDECGIIVGGIDTRAPLNDRKVYILEDASLKAPPQIWAERVAQLSKEYPNATIIAERNQGGGLVTATLHAIDSTLDVRTVWSKDSKYTRAGSVLLKYQSKHVFHCDRFTDLENQMVIYDPEKVKKSPDRLDALSQLVIHTLITPMNNLYKGQAGIKSPGQVLNYGHKTLRDFNVMKSIKNKRRFSIY